MVYYYDTAIIEDMRSLFDDERITICPQDNLFKTIARLNEDDIKMPLVSVVRTGWSLRDSQHPMRFRGGILNITKDEQYISRLQTIPIRINYLFDVWTQHREENDNIVRELIFWYMTHPTLEVKIPYGADMKHTFNIYFDSNIEDNSDIVDQANHGEYFRQTLSVYTDDAYLWKSTTDKPIIFGGADLYVKDVDGYVKDN